jgi:DNA/RNA-binding domain of Phe-tRNA-synthetase-like protein
MNPLEFRYHPDLLKRFPDICGGAILVQSLSNAPTPPDLLQAYQTEQRAVLYKIGEQPLSEIPSLAAWRAAFRLFGVDPTKYRSAAEALLRRLTKKGDIPSISALVDLCNLVSIRYALPVAAFDTRALSGAVTVRFASGDETFTAHDAPEPEHPEPGEVIFADPAGLVVARRWCWKQSVESTVELDTRSAIITVEAQHPSGYKDIQGALKDLSILLERFVGGKFKSGVLDKENPTML